MTEFSSSGPSASEAYGYAWSELKRCFLELLLIGVVWALLSAPSGWLQESLLGTAYHVLVLAPVGFGGMYAFLRAARGGTPEVGDLFVAFRKDYVQAVLASLLMGALIGIGFVLLVVPGFLAMVRLAWVPYLVTDEGLDAIGAVRASWERTRGYGWTIFGIFVLAIPIVLVGFLLLVVGAIPALMWVQLASAVLYAAVTSRDRAAREAGLPEAPR
ncbi:MAG: hypothetical protein FJ148_26775 [Deltaproteobacteria bacterium]|nr:hypothetical protein [Deltaproteobacteria bacterium]